MKKLMIILLVGILTLGLSGVVYAGTQEISATIATSVAITTDPVALTGTNITAAGGWEDASKTIVIAANCPYDVTVMVTNAIHPTGEAAVDVKMTASVSPYTDLNNAFQLGYWSATGGATSTDATMSYPTAITTGAVTFVSCPVDPPDGSNTLGIKYKQTITLADPSYELTGAAQLNYQIKLTWTASVGVT
ncbi:hypothetical protein KKA86_06125 [bacterium]|nr:hypothetical protein [bacterium]MBU4602658.1 hypothetical protein [bacterium]